MSITINQQAQLIRDACHPVAQENNGVAAIASDLAHMWRMAYTASDKLRILIAFTGEDARGPFSLAAATFRESRR